MAPILNSKWARLETRAHISDLGSTADTGAQCLQQTPPRPGAGVKDLLQSEINLNRANSTTFGNLGVFFANVRGVYQET